MDTSTTVVLGVGVVCLFLFPLVFAWMTRRLIDLLGQRLDVLSQRLDVIGQRVDLLFQRSARCCAGLAKLEEGRAAEPAIPAGVDPAIPAKFDPGNAPEGYIARPSVAGCHGCAFFCSEEGQPADDNCDTRPCVASERSDGHDVIFIKKKER